MPADDAQVMLTFRYREQLDSIVRDLERIDKLTPCESSRHGCLMKGEAAAIIEARKDALLRYIQVICRDHILWSKKLLDEGWKVKPKKQRRKRASR